MARYEDTILIPDASKADALWDLLETLDLPEYAIHGGEESDTFPGQEYALDLAATTAEDMASYITTLKQALADEFGWRDLMTVNEYDALAAS